MSYMRTDLATIIGKKTMHVTDMKLLAKEVAAYLMENNHVYDLESLMRDVLAYRQSHGVLEAEVISAYELDDQTLQEVKQLLKAHYPEAKKVVVHTHIDPEVVGGLRVTLANEQLDMSVRSKLDMFRRLTIEGNV